MRSETTDLAARKLSEDWRYQAGLQDGRDTAEPLRTRTAQRDLALLALYRVDPVAGADVCDEIDRSGGLLGRVRLEVERIAAVAEARARP